MTRNWAEKLNYYGIPERMHPGIVRYVEHGVAPGHFLQAVFSNDLIEAVSRSDDQNAQMLDCYVRLMVNQFPGDSYGSKETVRQWIKRGGIKGNDKNEPLPKHQWSRWAV